MSALLPLPSLLRASAQDAATAQMRQAGRSHWTRGDYNTAASDLESRVAAAYGLGPEGQARFQTAEALERAGVLRLSMSARDFEAALRNAAVCACGRVTDGRRAHCCRACEADSGDHLVACGIRQVARAGSR